MFARFHLLEPVVARRVCRNHPRAVQADSDGDFARLGLAGNLHQTFHAAKSQSLGNAVLAHFFRQARSPAVATRRAQVKIPRIQSRQLCSQTAADGLQGQYILRVQSLNQRGAERLRLNRPAPQRGQRNAVQGSTQRVGGKQVLVGKVIAHLKLCVSVQLSDVRLQVAAHKYAVGKPFGVQLLQADTASAGESGKVHRVVRLHRPLNLPEQCGAQVKLPRCHLQTVSGETARKRNRSL